MNERKGIFSAEVVANLRRRRIAEWLSRTRDENVQLTSSSVFVGFIPAPTS